MFSEVMLRNMSAEEIVHYADVEGVNSPIISALRDVGPYAADFEAAANTITGLEDDLAQAKEDLKEEHSLVAKLEDENTELRKWGDKVLNALHIVRDKASQSLEKLAA